MLVRRIASLSTLALVLVAIGCARPADDTGPGVDPDVTDRGRFGDPYHVVSNYNPADPDLYPLLSGDTLLVRLTYSGGCETHTLDLDHEVRQDTAFLWIRHNGRGDACEALVEDELEEVLPPRVLGARVIAILHPQGGPPQILYQRP